MTSLLAIEFEVTCGDMVVGSLTLHPLCKAGADSGWDRDFCC